MKKYKQIRKLGKGVSAQVWLARNEQTNEMVAIKQVSAQNTKKIKPFEAYILKNVEHHNIIKCYEQFEQNKTQYIVLQYCEKGQLWGFIQKLAPFPEQIVKIIIYFITQALAQLNYNNICHRDLKPQNILINSDYIVKIADFGFARTQVSANSVMTSRCGTPLYMPLELLKQAGIEYDRRADIWSLGIIMYIMLFVDHPYWKGKQSKQVLQANIIRGNLDTSKANISIECQNILRKCLMNNANDRYTAQQLVQLPYFDNIRANEKMYEQKLAKYLHQLYEHEIQLEIAFLLHQSINFYQDNEFSKGNLAQFQRLNIPCVTTLYRQTVLYSLNQITNIDVIINDGMKKMQIPFSLFKIRSHNKFLSEQQTSQIENEYKCIKATEQLLKHLTQPSFQIKQYGELLIRLLTGMRRSPKKIQVRLQILEDIDVDIINQQKIKQYLKKGNFLNMKSSKKVDVYVEPLKTIQMKRIQTIEAILSNQLIMARD